MTLLIASTGQGGASGLRALLPLVLVGLYVVRGAQVYRGDPATPTRLIWLHGVGAVFAVFQMSNGPTTFVTFQGIKVAINLFGALTAYLALRAQSRSPR